MRYHNITTEDMLQGDGLRTALWVAGCEMECKGCHNPQTWDINSGVEYDEVAEKELFDDLDIPEIAGLTFTGGHPLHSCNVEKCIEIAKKFRERYGNTKTIWLYTGYTWEFLMEEAFDLDVPEGCIKNRMELIKLCDVVVDGPFIQDLFDGQLKWRGSSNQRVIDVKKSLDSAEVILWTE